MSGQGSALGVPTGEYRSTLGPIPDARLGGNRVGRLVIILDPGVAVTPAELAAAWDTDEQARAVGPAHVESSPRGEFLPDVFTLVAIPIAVNLASTALTALVTRLVARLRNARPDQPEVE